jgi:glycine/serine hydroxymethyltransferase
VTTRGMHEAEMHRIAALIDAVISASADDTALLAEVRAQVKALADDFPLYPAVADASVEAVS